MVAWYWYLTIIPKARFGYEVGVGYNYLIFNTREWNNYFIIIFLKLQTSGYYNWILVNFILNITKRPDINLTSGKPRENHITCVLFANLVEWIIWKGRTLCLNYSLDKYCFCFPSLWLWNSTLDRSTWLPFNFVFFLHWIGAAQRPSFINQFVVIVVQWKASRCRIHLRSVMVRYGLAKVLRGVNLFKHKNLLMVLKTYSCKDFGAIVKIFKVKFCCCSCYIISSTYARISL